MRRAWLVIAAAATIVHGAAPAAAKVLPYDVRVDRTEAAPGDTVTVTVTPDPQNVLPETMEGLVRVVPTGDEVTVRRQADGTYRGSFVVREAGVVNVVGNGVERTDPVTVRVVEADAAPVPDGSTGPAWPWELTVFVLALFAALGAVVVALVRVRAVRASSGAPSRFRS